MHLTAAVALVADIEYKPGWSFSALDFSSESGGRSCLVLLAEYSAPNSNREFAPDYPEIIAVSTSSGVIYPDDYRGPREFLRRVLDEIIRMEVHEAREFFRLRSRQRLAPFHPHRVEGMSNWELTSRHAVTPA